MEMLPAARRSILLDLRNTACPRTLDQPNGPVQVWAMTATLKDLRDKACPADLVRTLVDKVSGIKPAQDMAGPPPMAQLACNSLSLASPACHHL